MTEGSIAPRARLSFSIQIHVDGLSYSEGSLTVFVAHQYQ